MRWPDVATAATPRPASGTVDHVVSGEGATGGPFDLFYLIQNPNPTAVTVTVSYLRPAPLPPIEKSYLVPAASRANIHVDREELPAGSGQRLLEAPTSRPAGRHPAIVVERAMYLSRPDQPFAAGHSSAGVTAPATSWYLAEGATGGFFDLFILIANPSATEAVVEARYLTATGRTLTKTYPVAANSRRTIFVDGEQFPGEGAALSDAAVSASLTSTNAVPIVVEGAMWWAQANWYEAHNRRRARPRRHALGVADGEVGGTDGPRHTSFSPTPHGPGSVRVTVCFEDGSSAARIFAVAASSRSTSIRVAVPVGGRSALRHARREPGGEPSADRRRARDVHQRRGVLWSPAPTPGHAVAGVSAAEVRAR